MSKPKSSLVYACKIYVHSDPVFAFHYPLSMLHELEV